MNKWKIIAGIIVFGSLWGFTECIIGSYLHDTDLPAGAIMTGVFALGFMVMSRTLYRQPGMQVGMGLVAGSLRLFNPFGGCFICSAIAIMAEAAVFEVVWYKVSSDVSELRKPLLALSMGVVSAYTLYVVGYITTQILTPVFSSTGFYLENLLVFLPQILARGLLAAILGSVIVPVALVLKSKDVSMVADRIYYPVTAAVSVFCWMFVIVNTLIILGM